MTAAIRTLQPNLLWEIFDLFTQYPRPSKHEAAVLLAIKTLCDQHQLSYEHDAIGNLIVRKPATHGMENRKGVVMQGHIDMVPQKNANTVHNFLTDPIRTRIIDGWVFATGTTLGADNGIGVAAGLAAMIDPSINHGPLELLITIDEEAGMTGAKHLQAGILNGEILLNLDTEDEGELYVGCAGGVDISATFSVKREALVNDSLTFKLALTGLRGGHSGLDIHLGRGNANKLLNRFLLEYSSALDLSIVHLEGGSLRNAIARECFATIVVPTKNQQALTDAVAQFKQTLQQEYGSVEAELSFTSTLIDDNEAQPKTVYNTDEFRKVIQAVAACVHGVTRMSADFENTVESSNNLAVVRTEGETLKVLCLARSLSDSARDDLGRSIAATFELAGAQVDISGEYPGWKPNPDSNMLTLMSTVHESLFGYTPKVKVIHAGLECGLLGKPYPHWDMISFGPNIRNAHSPDEKVEIKSVQAFWDLLVATLAAIPEK